MNVHRWSALAIACAIALGSGRSHAQEHEAQVPATQPADTPPPAEAQPAAAQPGEDAPSTPPGAPGAAAPPTAPSPEAAPPTAAAVAPPPAGIDVSPSAAAASTAPNAAPGPRVDSAPEPAPADQAPIAERTPLLTGSHIRRSPLQHDGLLIIDSPLTTGVGDGRDYLQRVRQFSGPVAPDTTTALGLGMPGIMPSSLVGLPQLRIQPTLVLFNGRRLVSAPFTGPEGTDVVDLNQLPITLVDSVEITRGNAGALYGDGANAGVINFITHRDYKGVEVELGGQATQSFDQHEEDVTVTVGVGDKKTGMNAAAGYFSRQPLLASDRDWIHDRGERIESLFSNPGTYQPIINFVEYPYPDPGCGVATKAGQASGLETRIPLFGKTVTRDGRNVLGDRNLLPTSPVDYQTRYRINYDMARGNGNGRLDRYETSTYCTGNFSSVNDLILKEQRLQLYTTFWNAFSDHTEGYGELGYYTTRNENRVAPSFPMTRIAPDPAGDARAWIPPEHADQPIEYPGFSTNPQDPVDARAPNTEYFLGRAVGLHAGANLNVRTADVARVVLGMRGDLQKLGQGTVVETWDWDLAGVYSASHAVTRVPDVLLDKLSEALASCPKTVRDDDVGSATYGMDVPSTIKQRQEMGCYNPFYNSVTNNAAIDPLGLSKKNPANDRGFITTDSETIPAMHGFGRQDGGYICDPNDPESPCPAKLDPTGDGSYALAGTPNTQQVIDRITGEHVTEERRTLSTVDGVLRGQALRWSRGGLSFAAGGQYRRDTLQIDYDSAFNRRLYAFVFGAPDVPAVGRNVAAGFGELRMRMLDGLVELQPAGRIEYYDDVGTAVSWLGALALRPFAATPSAAEALKWLMLRGHVGRGYRAPSLLQLHGTYTDVNYVEFADRSVVVPQQIVGNPNLDFEKYTTFSGGLQWDFAGIHVGADFWATEIGDVVGRDNPQTLLHDCEEQFASQSEDCPEVVLLTGSRTIDHIESRFDNLASVNTNGIDGSIIYTLDTKLRRLGDFGTFVIGVQGTFLNQYLIDSPRALREYYRDGDSTTPRLRDDATRDYSRLHAEYDAAGYRNLENFAPSLPKLRFSVPVSWGYAGHMLGVAMRYIGSYYDDSEQTIEKYGLVPRGQSLGDLRELNGEKISAWVVFDAGYSFRFDVEGIGGRLQVGVINLLDTPPPAAEGPLGYDVGVHDPRGRMFYTRLTGRF